MRLLDRWHRTEGVNPGHEGEGRTLQVVAAAGTHEIHILRVVEANLLEGACQHRHDQFHLVDRTHVSDAVRLLVSYYCNLFHYLALPAGDR